MKKLFAVLMAAMMLFAACAFAEEAPAIRIGQVEYAAHGAGCFAVVSVVLQGDVIAAAKIDEFQFIGSNDYAEAVGVPNSDASFGENYPEGKVLGSKRVNNELYSINMTRAGSTVQIAASYDAIEAYVTGKTVAELEAAVAGSDSLTDAVSGATLADTKGYVCAVIAAAKAADVQKGTYTFYNKTGETVTELYFTDNVTGEKSVNLVGNGLAADGVYTVVRTLEAGEDAHHRFTLSFKTESGYEGSFATLSLETVPMTLLAQADVATGATQITFFAPAE